MALIRPGRDADSPGVIALISRCWADYPNCILDVEGKEPGLLAPAAYYAAQGGTLWVAEDAGTVAGMIAAVPRGAGTWEVCRVYVHPDRHGAGLAHRLLDTAEAYALAAGATRLLLWTDTRFDRAHRFYEKRSYVRTGPIRVLDSDPDILEFGYAKPVEGVMVLDAAGAASAVRGLAEVAAACGGPAEPAREAPWRDAAAAVARGEGLLLAGWRRGAMAGAACVRLDAAPHRAELADLRVCPNARRRGLGAALLHMASAAAACAGRALLTAAVPAGGPAAALLARHGWTAARAIPGYIRDALGQPMAASVFWTALDGDAGMGTPSSEPSRAPDTLLGLKLRERPGQDAESQR